MGPIDWPRAGPRLGRCVGRRRHGAARRTRSHPGFVAADLPAFLADLETLVNIDCGSYTKAGVDEVGALGGRVHGAARRRASPATRTPRSATRSSASSGAGRAAPRVLLIGHMDTVFDPGTAAARPFRIADGQAYGPGRHGHEGRAAHRPVRAAGRSPARAGELPFERAEVRGQPGRGDRLADLDARSSASWPRGVDAPSCSSAPGPTATSCRSRKGIVDARITIHGRAAHAGVEPEKGRSAILRRPRISSRPARAQRALAGRDLQRRGHRTAAPGRTSSPRRPASRWTCGRSAGEDLDAAVAAVRELMAAPAVPDVTMDMETMAALAADGEARAVAGGSSSTAVALAERLGFPLSDAATGGASDANTTSGMGVPSLDGLGPIGGNDHAPGEYLEVDSIVPRTTLAAALLLAVARDPVVRRWRAGSISTS